MTMTTDDSLELVTAHINRDEVRQYLSEHGMPNETSQFEFISLCLHHNNAHWIDYSGGGVVYVMEFDDMTETFAISYFVKVA